MKEVWKDIKGYKGLYQVSNLGRVQSLDRYVKHSDGLSKFIKGQVICTSVVSRGYCRAQLSRNDKRTAYDVHSLVASAFLGKRPARHHTHHKDHNKLNNRVDNLEYIPSGKHARHHLSGEGCHKSKLTRKDVVCIRRRLKKGETQKDIALDYGVSRSTIGEIKRGATWNNI